MDMGTTTRLIKPLMPWRNKKRPGRKPGRVPGTEPRRLDGGPSLRSPIRRLLLLLLLLLLLSLLPLVGRLEQANFLFRASRSDLRRRFELQLA